jgi:hypothetical protein
MRWGWVSREAMTEVGLKLAGTLMAVAVFLVVAVGGGVYRTDCIDSHGQLSRTWGLDGDIPTCGARTAATVGRTP